jgi:dUTP pyrophosphatase
MIGKLNEFRKTIKGLNDLQDQLGSVNLEGMTEMDTSKILDSLGIDVDQLEEGFQKSFDKKVRLEYVLNSENKELEYAYKTDSGFDIRSNEMFELKPLERKLVSTGLFVDVPERCEIQVRPKSGLAIKRGLSVVNTPGTVDYGYTGEIKVILINLSNEVQEINIGDKIAQGVVCPVIQGGEIDLVRVNKIKNKDRNANGFGSTGN